MPKHNQAYNTLGRSAAGRGGDKRRKLLKRYGIQTAPNITEKNELLITSVLLSKTKNHEEFKRGLGPTIILFQTPPPPPKNIYGI
jgi:hypothetical protein